MASSTGPVPRKVPVDAKGRLDYYVKRDAATADAQARQKANGAGKTTAVGAPVAPKPSTTSSPAPAKATPAKKPKPKGANPPKPTINGASTNTTTPGKSNAGEILAQMKAAKTTKKGGTGRFYQGTPLKITAPRGNSTASRERARQKGRQGERDRRK